MKFQHVLPTGAIEIEKPGARALAERCGTFSDATDREGSNISICGLPLGAPS